MKKKVILSVCIIIILTFAAVPITHFYGDKIAEVSDSKSSETVNIAKNENARNIETLKELYPEYFFEPDTFKGIEIYVWQLAEDNYMCGALPGTNAIKPDDVILDLFDKSVTIEEMNSILSYCKIPKEEVVIIPCIQPLSSYAYTIDDEYTKKVEAMFDF